MEQDSRATKKQRYERPEMVRHGNLKEITLTSFQPPPPPDSDAR